MLDRDKMQEEEIHLRDYWKVIIKRSNSVLTFFSVLVVVVTIGTLTTTPVYRASTRVLIDRENQNVANLRDVYYDFYSEDYYHTQYELIKSAAVAYKAVKNLNLEGNPEFNPAAKKMSEGFLSGLSRALGSIFGGKKTSDDTVKDDPAVPLAKKVQGGLRVEPVKNSRIVNISYEYHDPKLAAAIANGVANAYVEQVLDIKMGAAKQAVEWMSKKIDEQKRTLEDSQKALQEYMKNKDVVELENKEALTPQKLQNLGYQLVLAEAKRKDTEALFNQVKNLANNLQEALTVPAIAGDPVMQSLRTEEIKIEKDSMEMSKKYGEKHPQMIRLREDLRALREKMSSESKRIITSIKNDYELAKARETGLRNSMAQGKGEAMVLSEKAIQYGALKREVESNQQLYDALLKRIKETSLIEEVKSFNIYIVDRAEIPKGPVRPRSFLNILLSIIVGAFGGVGIAFFLEYIDNTFKKPEDVEEKLALPLLGVVPYIKQTEIPDGNFETITHTNQKSTISETYRALRTSILLSTPEPVKSIAVTSSVENEGKTTTAVNLAITLAQMEKMVLLVDADLRKPKVHSVLGMDNSIGLSNFLARQVVQNMIKASEIPSLSIITAGPLPPNPSELLGSKRMKEFLDIVNEKFDIVVFDTAPLITVTDTTLLSDLVDGTILVIRSGRTTFDIAKRGVKLLRDINAKVLGVVLNSMDTAKEGYRYLYPYYYQYGSEKEKTV
ncbi:MAG: polysaccharide biosynthesis tyrosine autokinase [Nitrospirae bacterium]|nr:polysaccharide biosynthesis tyrosine autokinase [Nitrospirota bacterium]MCL5422341.1 polysaccharide biosynthesis tyrosine autokinase [Nitrospirota bacterium]